MRRIRKGTRAAALGAAVMVALTGTLAWGDTFELENGDKFEATVLEKTDLVVIVDHPVFGRMEIPVEQIKVEVEEVTPGLFGTRFLRGWERSVEFGLNGSTGNSDSIGLNAGLRLFGEGDTYRSRLRGQYFFANQRTVTQADKEKTTNNGYLDARHDFLIFGDSPFFLFLNARYDYDEFQDFENRFTGQGGAGYTFYDDDVIYFDWTAGLGVNYQGGDVDDTIGEFSTGFDFRWNILEGQRILADTFYYADIERWTDFRILSNLLYEISLDWIDGLAFNAGLKNEYRNEVGPVVAPAVRNEKNNLQYFAGLSYEF